VDEEGSLSFIMDFTPSFHNSCTKLTTSLDTHHFYPTPTGGKRYLRAEIKDIPALFSFSQVFYVEDENSM
jgi:hypothetical protein